jgi:tellurite methyltransferase
MTAEDRVRWDTYFRSRAHDPYPDPDPLLLQFTPPAVGEMRALDLCGGLGQNGLWLAEQGYTVDIMDISRVALKRARVEMTLRNLRSVNLLQVDVDDLQLELEAYDLICVFRYLRRGLFPQIARAVRPGGRVIYETFHVGYLESVPNFNRAFLLERGELRQQFDGWRRLYDEETRHTAQLVAIKPTALFS